MRAPLSWLRDFAPFPGNAADLSTALDSLGLVVEEVQAVGDDLHGVMVARVVSTRAHPDADKVQLVDVDAGDGAPVQVVCGAFNFGPGSLVAFAPVGARLPNGMTIDRRKVRGEWSDGMLCSGAELRLSDDHAGILVLPSDDHVEPGLPLAEALGIEPDVVFDLDVTPNRPDALSMVGVARDLAAKLRLPFSLPDFEPLPRSGSRGSVTLKAKDLCPRFTAIVLEGVRVAPSPRWLVRRLTLAGMRSINNVVDVSNYVMLELGQPNHPYDLARLDGQGLLVRKAKKGESVVTLDGVERHVGPDDCVICDAQGRPVGIGGVMGGATAEISDATDAVLLETAYFDPVAISTTAKRVGLRTEASVRFERGCDPQGIERSVARFCALAAEVSGAAVAGGFIDVAGRLPKPAQPLVRPARVNAVLGTSIASDEMSGYLEPLGFECRTARGGWRVTIPPWRPDCTEEIDVVEEVARHHGYSEIPPTMPVNTRVGALTPYQRDRRRVRDVLAGAGLSEAWTTSFLAPDDLRRCGLPVQAVEVENPLAHEESLLRPSLMPGLLRAVALNASHRHPEVSLFEIGNIFLPGGGEREHLSVVLAGHEATAAKRLWDTLADAMALERVQFQPVDVAGVHPSRVIGLPFGVLGEVDPGVLASHDIETRVGWLDVDLGQLLTAPRRDRRYRPISRFPSSDIDLAFVVEDSVPAAALEQTLRQAGGELLVDLHLFDVFRSEQLGDGRRSLAYRLRFNAMDRTLTDEEVAAIRQRCIATVEDTHGAALRG